LQSKLLAYARLMDSEPPAAPPAAQEEGQDALPEPLAVLRCRGEGLDEGPQTTFYILGTAHVSQESCRDVAKLIKAVAPQV
jgi:hypothetical protein